MPNAAIVAAALTDHSSHPFALWVGGVDMIKQPGTAGNLYGVPIDTIEITENGPGGVSSLRCSVEDPLNVLPIPTAGTEVVFMDIADDHPEFGGYVQAVDVRPHEGQQGRWLDLTCAGYEILLDWEIVSLTLAASPTPSSHDVWQSLAAGTPVRALAVGGTYGTQAQPIAAIVCGFGLGAISISGSTLRNAIANAWAQNLSTTTLGNTPLNITVDFTKGLRIWPGVAPAGGANVEPDDYVTLTVDDTAHTNTSAELRYTLTPADVVRSVLIIGGSGTLYGPFSDGSGIIGQGTVLNDSTITTAAQAALAASQYLASLSVQVRGSLHLQTFTHGATKYQAGSLLTLTDAPAGLSGVAFVIGSIEKRYNPGGGTEEWTINFGGLAPSLTNAIRRQTRATLS